MDKQSRGPARLDKGGRVVDASCESIGCPFLGDSALSRCKNCPGPNFFISHHACHDCPIKRKSGKADQRCIICPGPSDEPNHKGASHIYIDGAADGGQQALSKRLITNISPASINLPPEEAERSRETLRYFMEMDVMTFSYVRDVMKGGGFSNFYDVNDGKRAALAKVEGFDKGVERRVRDVFMAMTVDQFAIVKHLLAGGSLNTYAFVYNAKRQYAFNKMRELMERCPEVRVIVKERKQMEGRIVTLDKRDRYQKMFDFKPKGK